MPVLEYRDASPAETRTLNMVSAFPSIVRRMLSRIGASRVSQPHPLSIRDNMVAIPTVYYGLDDGPAPGTVVGATLGAVAGFILLVWLIQTLTNNRRNAGVEEEVIVRHERSPRSRKSRRSEMRSVSRGSRPERVVRQERIIRDSSRAPPPPQMRSSFIVEERPERRVDGDDVVEVIEEHSSVAPPRRKSRRGSGTYRYR